MPRQNVPAATPPWHKLDGLRAFEMCSRFKQIVAQIITAMPHAMSPAPSQELLAAAAYQGRAQVRNSAPCDASYQLARTKDIVTRIRGQHQRRRFVPLSLWPWS